MGNVGLLAFAQTKIGLGLITSREFGAQQCYAPRRMAGGATEWVEGESEKLQGGHVQNMA